jgi:hypothetical protein
MKLTEQAIYYSLNKNVKDFILDHGCWIAGEEAEFGFLHFPLLILPDNAGVVKVNEKDLPDYVKRVWNKTMINL